MDAIVHDETVREVAMLANFVRSSPIETEEQARKAGEFDQVALKVSEGRPDNKPIVPPPVKSKPLRRSGGSRTARLLFRKLATVGIAAVAVAAALVTCRDLGPVQRRAVDAGWARAGAGGERRAGDFRKDQGSANCGQSVRPQRRPFVRHRPLRFRRCAAHQQGGLAAKDGGPQREGVAGRASATVVGSREQHRGKAGLRGKRASGCALRLIATTRYD